jgi:hypothetical protein
MAMASKSKQKLTGRDGTNPKAEASPTTDETGKTCEQKMTILSMDAVVRNAATIHKFTSKNFGATDLLEAIDCLRGKAARVCGGDLAEAETMLTAQAVALDAIFNELALRAASNFGQYLNAADTYLRLALKAQSQCRTTIEALAEIKNPRPVAFVKQANIANGPQQVNNGVSSEAARAHAGKSEISSNKLLGVKNGEWLDTRTKSATSPVNQELASVGKIDRAAK